MANAPMDKAALQRELEAIELMQNATRPSARPSDIMSQFNTVAPILLISTVPGAALLYKRATGNNLGAVKASLLALGMCVIHGFSTLIFDKSKGMR